MPRDARPGWWKRGDGRRLQKVWAEVVNNNVVKFCFQELLTPFGDLAASESGPILKPKAKRSTSNSVKLLIDVKSLKHRWAIPLQLGEGG